MARHSVVILTILFSLFLQHCSKPKSTADHAPRGGEPTDNGPPAQAPAGDGGGGTETGGGSNVGNGGSGIVCRTGNAITRIELFDFYEAKILRGWEPSLAYTPDASKTIFEQALDTAQFMVDTRWKSTDPVMATYLTERLKSLPSEVIFVDQPMPLQDDVAAVINAPTGCRREQIAIASEPYLAQRRYTVRKNYFEHPNFSNLDRAGLILHELLYRLTSSNGAKTSRGVRYINAVLFADQQSETLAPLKHYFEVMKEAEFPWGGAHGVPVYLRTLNMSFRDIGGNDLESGLVVPGAPADTVFGPQKIACATLFDANGKVYSTHTSTHSYGKTVIPGVGEIGFKGGLWGAEADGRPDTLMRSTSWETPYETLKIFCENSEAISKCLQYIDDQDRRNYRAHFPTIDRYFPVHFATPLYSVEANVNLKITCEWKDNEPAKCSGTGQGFLTFASGDKCSLFAAIDSLSNGYGGRLARCAARIVPGGSWVKFEGVFSQYGDNRNVFYLDRFSDTEYTHAAGGDKVSLTLTAASSVEFDGQGRLRQAQLGKDVLMCSTSGGLRLFLGNSFVYFDEQGCARENF